MLEAFRVFQLAEQRKAVLPVARLRRGAARKRCRAERAQCRRRQRGGGGADDGPSSEFHAKILRRSRTARHDAIAGDYVGFSVHHQRPAFLFPPPERGRVSEGVSFAMLRRDAAFDPHPPASATLRRATSPLQGKVEEKAITKRPGLARPRHECIAALITSSGRLLAPRQPWALRPA